MSEPVQRRHVLEPFLARVENRSPAGGGVTMAVLPYRGYLNLRGDPNDGDFLEAVREALGRPLPLAANTFTEGKCRIFWLGPDEWLVMTEPCDEVPHTEKDSAGDRKGAPLAGEEPPATRLADALATRACALTDLTGGQICIRLGGRNARDVLAKGCTLDFHPRVFRPGQCAQTLLGKASILIARSPAGTHLADAGVAQARDDSVPDDDAGVFDIVVRRTFAEYAAEWLYRSAAEYGVRVNSHG